MRVPRPAAMITTLSAMRLRSFGRPVRCAIIGALLLAASVLLTACSALRFGYNNAPEFAYRWLDGFVDFREVQAEPVRLALAEYFEWHRATQLADYAALLARVQARLREPTTQAAVCLLMDEATARLDTAYQRAVPMLADFVQTMSPAQLESLERRYAKNNREFRRDYLQESAAERDKASVKRAIERAESLYGKLDGRQRDFVAERAARSPFDAELWFSERRARQQDILATVRPFVGADAPAAGKGQEALRALPARFVVSPREKYRSYSERMAQHNCAFSAELHNLTTQEQRQVAIKKLKGWEGDLRALAGDAR